jgi:S1-C subfamily serine protease
VNPLDLVAILLIVLAVVLGFSSGALPQVGGLLGAVSGGALAVLAITQLVEPLDAIPVNVRPYAVLAALLVAVGIGESVGSAIGRTAARSLGTGFLGAADRVAGGLTGAAQALLVVWLAGGLLAIGPVPRLTEAAQTSTAIRTLNAVLPPPDAIAGELGQLLGDSGLPDVFVGFEPLPRPPVDPPTDATARQIAGLAEASTVRVLAIVCGDRAAGSGVAVAAGYVVTNAHVVAGSRDGAVSVATVAGDPVDARVVLFDPQLDVALLHAPDLRAPPMRFTPRDPDRGTAGAALGYPGGGSLSIVPAAVTGAYRATGRDIYGRLRVDRDILELRAEIERGDSGGPFVLRDGTIGGLVFAEARTDRDVGYALSPTTVAVRITPSIGRTGAVETGSCLRS